MSLILAREFATLLDNNSYDEASQFIAEDCEYHYWEGSYRGRKNIISIYRLNHRESKKIFDEINYSSEAGEMTDGNYKIDFVDKLRKGHKWHEFRSFQIIKFKENQIAHIEHYEIPGEIESLKMFFDTSRSRNVDLL